MKAETPHTIAELWDRFQKLGNYIETEKFLQSWGTKGSDGLSHDGRNHSEDEIELQSLRQQLVERCSEMIDCTDGHFAISHKLIVRISHGELAAFTEASAIFAFWAWELQQREKEADNV